jgi:hypothetical protein
MRPIQADMPFAHHRLGLAVLIAAIVGTPSPSSAATGPLAEEPPQFRLAYWEAMPGPMHLPVFDGMAMEIGQHVVVLGGFTRGLEATRAIQIRTPIDGWRPIGSALREPRARASLLPLEGNHVLVLGGYSGTWGKNAVARDDGEILDPLVAGSARDIEPFGESLNGHAATRLNDGRIAVSCGCSLRLFDPTTETWSRTFELACERRHHASIVVGETLVLIGGDDESSVESIDLRSLNSSSGEPGRLAEAGSVVWESTLVVASDRGAEFPFQQHETMRLTHAAAIPLDGRFAFAAGGYLHGSQTTVSSTWVLDVAKRLVKPSVTLPLPQGASDLTLTRHPRGVIVLDGEWRASSGRGNANAGFLIARILDASGPATPDLWRLPTLGSSFDLAHRILVRCADGNVESIGGYRYRAPDASPNPPAAMDGEVGVFVDGSSQRLVVDVSGTAD